MPSSTVETHRHRRNTSPPYLSRSQRKLLLFFLKCIVMVFVIAIFLFFLGFAALVLLHFLFMSNPFQRRCTRFLHPTNAASNSLYAATQSETLLPFLPNVPYSASAFPRNSDCSICLDAFQDGEECRNLPICNHLFHAKCVDRWIGKKPTCPVCRARVDLDPAVFAGSRISGDERWKRVWVDD